MRMVGGILLVLVAARMLAAGDAQARRPVHSDAPELERTVLEVTRAFLRDDLAEAKRRLDRVEDLCRRLAPEEREIFGPDITTYDQAFHTTLDRSRELAAKGQSDKAFDQFVWVQRACRMCHQLSREAGLLESKPAAQD